jgi:hypothetical protein
MIKFAEFTPVWKLVTGLGAVITALGVIAGGVTWAADTRYYKIADQQQYEARELKRDIKKLEIEQGAGETTPADDAFLEFLRQELEELR